MMFSLNNTIFYPMSDSFGQWFMDLDLDDPFDRTVWVLFSLSPILLPIIVIILITIIW